MSLKDKRVKEIMELFEKGQITAEQADNLINEVVFESETLKGKTIELGSKVGNVLEKSKPTVKKVLRKGFVVIADVSANLAEKLEEAKEEVFESEVFESDIFEEEVTSIVLEKDTSLVETQKETHLVEIEKEVHIIKTEKDS